MRPPDLQALYGGQSHERVLLMTENLIPFPLPHRGDPDPRRMALASIGFQWRAGLWRRGRVALSDVDIDAMDARTWAQCLRRWTARRPGAQE